MARRLAPFLLALAVACTQGGAATPAHTSSPSPAGPSSAAHPVPVSPSPGSDPIVLDVVADAGSAPGATEQDATYLDGMRVAVAHVNATGGVNGQPIELSIQDDRGEVDEAAGLIADLATTGSTAILYVGPGTALTAARSQLEDAGGPVVLLGGDLYTSHALFPEAYQATIPWEWQANVIARYLVTDRHAHDVVFVGAGPEAATAEDALRAQLAYWGGHLDAAFASPDPQTGFTPAMDRSARADWVVVDGSIADANALLNGVEEASGKARPGIAGPSTLLAPEPGLGRPERSNTVAASVYTWAGWAEPIPRVATFRDRYQAMFHELPHGLEQEGYDAVLVLTKALAATHGEGGPALTAAIEALPAGAYSSFPVDFGPDDHVFPPRDELGLFAVDTGSADREPWMVTGADLWRPLMRTFTYDGERTSVLDRDRPVFFPFWGKGQPGPEYWRSRYGIVTKPNDPRH